MKFKSYLKKSTIYVLCTLMLIFGIMLLGVTAYADGGGTPPAHTDHKICNDRECTDPAHSVTGGWTELTGTLLANFYSSADSAYIIPAGNYYLSADLDADKNIAVSENVSICLNGKTLTIAAGRNMTVTAGAIGICDCSKEGTGKINNSNIYLQGTSVFNLYSGKLIGKPWVLRGLDDSVVNIYGGLIETDQPDNNVQAVIIYSTLNMFGGHIKGNRMGVYAQDNSTVNVSGGIIESVDEYTTAGTGLYILEATVNITGGTFRSADGYGIHAKGATLSISPSKNEDVNIYGDKYGLFVEMQNADVTIEGGVFSCGSEGKSAISARGTTVIKGAPDIQGNIEVHSTVIGSTTGIYYLDVSSYTGTNKLILRSEVALTDAKILAKGDISKIELLNTGWMLIDAIDENSVAVVKAVHGHNICGEDACTHAGNAHGETVIWTPLTQTLLNTYLATERGADLPDAYILPEGNYFLTTALNIGYNPIIVTGNTAICFNGREITGYRSIMFEDENVTLNLCDCLGTGGMGTNTAIISESNKTGITVNIWGGNHILASGNLFSINSKSTVLNMYGGVLQSTGSGNINNATFNMYGGLIEAEIFALGINNANANFFGGTLKTTSTVSNSVTLRIIGNSNVNIKKLNIESKNIGIYSTVLANTVIDPEKDTDVTVNAQNYAVYLKDDKSVALNNSAKDGDGTPESWTGKLIIKGGTFTGASSIICLDEGKLTVDGGLFTSSQSVTFFIKKGLATVNGGVFKYEGAIQSQAVNVQADGILVINGGEFNSVGDLVIDSVAAVGRIKVSGAPLFNNKIRTWNVGKIGETDEYWLDFSGYTGEKKINIDFISSIIPAEGLVIGLADSEKLAIEGITDWILVNGDGGDNTVVKFICAGHKGDPSATCTVSGTCTVCAQSYTVPHIFGDWQTEISATCMATGTKAHKTCSECSFHYDASGVKIDDITIAVNSDAHAWDEGSVTEAATCSDEGTKTFICTYNREHTRTEDVAIDVNAHSFGQWAQTTAPKCAEVGKETRVCEHNAEHKEIRDVAALDHDFSVMQSNDDEHWSKCSRCDETEGNKAHVYEDGVCICGVEKPGLSGGAIAGIVIGSVAVLGVGGFSLFWFAIKKKTWSDLVAVFKK